MALNQTHFLIYVAYLLVICLAHELAFYHYGVITFNSLLLFLSHFWCCYNSSTSICRALGNAASITIMSDRIKNERFLHIEMMESTNDSDLCFCSQIQNHHFITFEFHPIRLFSKCGRPKYLGNGNI